MKFAHRNSCLSLLALIAAMTPGVPKADASADTSRWFIDWGGKTQPILHTTAGLPGVRAGVIREAYAFGAAAYTLPNPISEGSIVLYQKQISYTLGGMYAEYRYAATDSVMLLPNFFVGFGAGDYQTRDTDVVGHGISGGYLLEPAMNVRIAILRNRFLNVGGGYSYTNRGSGVKSGTTINIAFRIEWR